MKSSTKPVVLIKASVQMCGAGLKVQVAEQWQHVNWAQGHRALPDMVLEKLRGNRGWAWADKQSDLGYRKPGWQASSQNKTQQHLSLNLESNPPPYKLLQGDLVVQTFPSPRGRWPRCPDVHLQLWRVVMPVSSPGSPSGPLRVAPMSTGL